MKYRPDDEQAKVEFADVQEVWTYWSISTSLGDVDSSTKVVISGSSNLPSNATTGSSYDFTTTTAGAAFTCHRREPKHPQLLRIGTMKVTFLTRRHDELECPIYLAFQSQMPVASGCPDVAVQPRDDIIDMYTCGELSTCLKS